MQQPESSPGPVEPWPDAATASREHEDAQSVFHVVFKSLSRINCMTNIESVLIADLRWALQQLQSDLMKAGSSIQPEVQHLVLPPVSQVAADQPVDSASPLPAGEMERVIASTLDPPRPLHLSTLQSPLRDVLQAAATGGDGSHGKVDEVVDRLLSGGFGSPCLPLEHALALQQIQAMLRWEPYLELILQALAPAYPGLPIVRGRFRGGLVFEPFTLLFDGWNADVECAWGGVLEQLLGEGLPPARAVRVMGR